MTSMHKSRYVCVPSLLNDCDCNGGRDCDEACVRELNNQHPSEVMETRRLGGRDEAGRDGRCIRCPACIFVGGHRATASWNHAFNEAPCVMGGREVNSTAPKLYLIFIHMNAPGRDRLPQTN